MPTELGWPAICSARESRSWRCPGRTGVSGAWSESRTRLTPRPPPARLAGTATATPKRADGVVESIRMLRVARVGAIKGKTAATNALRALVVTAPGPLRGQLRSLRAAALITACRRLRVDTDQLADPAQAAKFALKTIAERIHLLGVEACLLGTKLSRLASHAAPATTSVFGLGPDTAGALIVAIGDNPDRLRSESAFARFAGVAPIPASSGKTNRHPSAGSTAAEPPLRRAAPGVGRRAESGSAAA